MKTKVAQTSIWSYHSLDDLTPRQAEVLRTIRKMMFASNREIAQDLDMEIGSITGRTNELVAKGMVVEAYKQTDPKTRKTVTYWKAIA